ncbi:hypothetical protein GBN24_11945 [Plesiomonas shigelloides]|uniref:hypothetical protein n=1 Tax=Plesiomonas shigelloides TaxID=703 RepID=UPI00126146E8|nr:hypothetical protein [Plesiomonas shigelloides]KAB7689054.1 hypothetical protein GBN24_11945 [Plesiomonas shigelloides]
MKKLVVAALVGSFLVSGCGSIINGSSQNMSVQAVPSSAKIQLISSNGSIISESNGSLFYNLKRSNGFFSGASYNIKVTEDGYQEQVIPLVSSASGWYLAGNIALGGFIGWLIVDPATGGMWALEAKNGQDIENLKVILLENASDKMMAKAKKIS